MKMLKRRLNDSSIKDVGRGGILGLDDQCYTVCASLCDMACGNYCDMRCSVGEDVFSAYFQESDVSGQYYRNISQQYC